MAQENDSTATEEAHYLSAEQLRPGVYVILDVAWFRHSFTLNSFKIRNAEQVRELRELKLPRYRFDPRRSDAAETLNPVPPPPEPPKADTAKPELDAATLAQREKLAAVSAWRDTVANVERAFSKASTVMKNLNRNLIARPKETLEEMGGLVDQMVDAFLNSQNATLQVMSDKVGGEEVYYHSLNVTILALMLAKDLGFPPEMARELGIGSMLHDIGLMEIPDKVLLKNPEEYNNAERTLRAQHVEYGLAIGRKIGLSPQALSVIGQHHEMVDGSGYPKACKAEAISAAARLVAVVNSYDNLCNPLDIHKAMTPHEALSFMYAKRRDKFDTRVLQLMIRCLGVYPPGSIVQLSNEALAAVTSVNPKKPLRPWIMVYNPAVPKEKALMVDMEQETSISIVKALRPAVLAPKVAAYLNPRKRVTYFFDDGKSASSNNK